MWRTLICLGVVALLAAVACDSDGGGPAAGNDVASDTLVGDPDTGGVDSCPDGTVERYGACVPVVCESDICVGSALSPCINDGTTLGAPAPCPGNLTCAGVAACRTSCSESGHCVGGYLCVDGVCEMAREDGAACDRGSQCLSGTCARSFDDDAGICVATHETHCVLAVVEGAPSWTEDGYRQCAGSGWRACSDGVWGSVVLCRGAACQTGQLSPAETCVDGEGCVWEPSAPCSGHYACADETSCLDTCAGDGDCGPGGYACTAGDCVLEGCTTGDAYCDGVTVMVCNAAGTDYEVGDTCTADETCLAGECHARVCTPNEQTCVEGGVATCAGDGLSVGEPVPCDDEEYCALGVCRPWVCTPQALLCQDGDVVVCVADGSGYEPEETCGEDEYCDAGACHTQVCVPDATSCNGNALVTCNAQGSGYAAMDDCAPQFCVGDACVDTLCDAGMRRCSDGGVPQQCAEDGSSWLTLDPCVPGRACQAGECVYVAGGVDEDFETGDLSRFPWATTGPHAWAVVAGVGRDGSYAVRTSPDHGASETASLSVTLGIRDSLPIGFWLKLETETDHFELVFYIDGVEQQRFSGVADWTHYEYAVGVGTHTFEWRYSRDEFVSTEHPMRNTVWIDDIDFPAYNSAPTVPTGVWPFDNAVISELRPTILWASDDIDPGDSILYEFQLDTDHEFGSPDSPGEIWEAEYTPADDLADGTTYWWRVRSKDDFADTWGPWSSPRSFTVRTTVPRTAWLQTTPAQLRSGDTAHLLPEGGGLANPANVEIVTAYETSSTCNYMTVRKAYDTSEDNVWCTHAPQAGYEYHWWDWTDPIAYGFDGGFRFRNIAAPQGATVASASLCLYQCYNCTGYPNFQNSDASLRITADRVGNAPLWPSSGTQLSGYAPTSAAVTWNISGLYESGECISSPEIKAIVQEVVDQPGWQPGNAMRFLLEDLHGDGSYSSTRYWERMFYSANNIFRIVFEEEGVIVSEPIRFADLPDALRWDQLQWAGEGSVRVQVLDGSGGLIPNTALPGNEAGFTANTVPLWGLDPAVYPELRLKAFLTRAGDDGVARLDEWTVTWGAELRWDFDNDGDTEGWLYGPETPETTATVADGVLRVDGDGADPNLRLLGLNLASGEFTELEVRLRSGNIDIYDTVRVSWANEAGGFASHERVTADVFLLDFQTVVFDLLDTSAGSGTWEGTLLNLRVDPVAEFDGGSGWFEVDSIILR